MDIACQNLRQHYTDKGSVASFIHAHLPTKMGRAFPLLLKHVADILLNRQFKGVRLQVLIDLTPGSFCVTPRCQCPARHVRENSRVPVFLRVGGRRKRLLVPPYVKHSTMTPASAREDAEAWAQDPLSVPLRYQILEEKRLPAALQGESLFRVHLPQCKTARQVPFVVSSMDSALVGMKKCLDSLSRSYQEYWGPVGMQVHLSEMLASMAKCWNFQKLCVSPPGLAEMQAFLKVAEGLRPMLQGLRKPSRYTLPWLERGLPTDGQLLREYDLFCKRLQAGFERGRWQHVESYKVQAVILTMECYCLCQHWSSSRHDSFHF